MAAVRTLVVSGALVAALVVAALSAGGFGSGGSVPLDGPPPLSSPGPSSDGPAMPERTALVLGAVDLVGDPAILRQGLAAAVVLLAVALAAVERAPRPCAALAGWWGRVRGDHWSPPARLLRRGPHGTRAPPLTAV